VRFRHPTNLLIHLLLTAICRIDREEISRVPVRGPLVIVTNHVTFLEVPALYLALLPRPVVGITKRETWNHPVLRYLANLWKAIPIRRNTSDSAAIAAALEALKAGKIVVIAPEGTRSGDGRLRKANAGVVTIAARSLAPVLPVAHFGGERIFENLRSLRRTRFAIRVGRPIHLSPAAASTRAAREAAIDEIMRSLADLMPERYRGYYA
jgi:1-acyl-sn-glycerol-3-phosphate acyltransferase